VSATTHSNTHHCFCTSQQQAVCDCSAIPAENGTFSGKFCELDCGTGSACGRQLIGYTSTETRPDDACCTATEDCLRVAGNFGYTTSCFSKARPQTCADCKTEGTANCELYNFYESDPAVPQIWTCVCNAGYGGLMCESKLQP
jgi:hypothetical protein